jgi:uncharacterized membrane protein
MNSSRNRSGSRNKAGIATIVLGALGVAYPFAVYASLGRLPAGALVLAALALVAARLALARGHRAARPIIPALLAGGLATALLGLVDAGMSAQAYPVLMSLSFAAAFGLSLRRGPTLVEVFASLANTDPSASARAYMRKVTWVWFVFLLANAAISAVTAVIGDLALWTLYNGLVSYLLMGLLFAVEFAIRRRVQRREEVA